MIIAHYRLDGDATDAVGDHDGVVNGSPSWVSAKLGQGMKSDGTSTGGYIAQSSVSDYLHGRPEASISMWVKKDAIQYGFFQLSGFANTNGNLYPYQTTTKVYLDTFRTNRLGPIYMHSSVLEWHHFCVTQKPGEWKLYQNGTLVHSAGADSQVSADYLQFEIGRNSGSRYAKGQFDDVRVYDHALSPREVRDLSLGLMAHYRFDGDFFDSVRYGLASPVGDVTFDRGVSGKCAVFSSAGKRVDIEPVSSESATLSFWYKRDDAVAANGWRTAFGCASNIHHAIFRSGTTFGLFDGSFKSSGINAPEDGEFHHCVVVLSGDGTAKFFYDGEPAATVSTTLSLLDYPIDRIGDWQGSYWIGYLDDPRIYATALTPAQVKELYQQRASIDSEGSVHTPLILQSPRARYIRDWTNGSTSNNGNHWLEVRAIYAGENISLGKPVTAISGGSNLSKVTDGTTSNSGYAQTTRGIPAWVQVDLEEVREIDEVQVWHYNADGRTYYGTKTEISEDGINWTTIFDSAVSGTYQETPSGVTHQAKAPGPIGATPRGLRAPDISEVGVTRGLVAWYPLIGDTKDYAGTNHAVNNGAVATAEGYEFDGTTNYLLIEPTTVDANADFTLSFWIYPRGTSTDTLYCARTRLGDGLSIFRLSGKIRFDLGSQWTTAVAPPLNEWSHVTVSREGDSKFIFFNGALVASTSIGTLTNFNPNLSTVGASQVNGSNYANYMDGIIRDFRSFDRALTEEEVGILYNLTNPMGSKMVMTDDCLYVKGQIKEVIS